jgi:predicted acetyltransferase
VTDVVIRAITVDDDMDAQVELGQHAFGAYSAGQRASWAYVAGLRASQGLFLGAFVDGRPAGAAMIHDLRQWWLGRVVPCAGIASVKVVPEHRGSGLGRMWMLRVVDGPAAIAARGFPPAVSATVPLELNDPARPANSGSWQLDVADGKGALSPAVSPVVRRSTPLTLGARGLAALYAGAPVAALRLAGLAAGGTPDTELIKIELVLGLMPLTAVKLPALSETSSQVGRMRDSPALGR